MKQHLIFDPETFVLTLLDQRKLPTEESFVQCKTVADVIAALKNMVVRGAPAIGVTAAFGCCIALKEAHSEEEFEHLLQDLESARPTAVNLKWAVQKMRALCQDTAPSERVSLATKAALQLQAEDIRICKTMGQFGQKLIPESATILTHCNAGALATAGYGTALGVIRAAHEAGKDISVICDETRPFLQGARLSAYELVQDGINATVVCDNSCAFLMKSGLITCCIVGADRIAANGDTANKIGTLGVAILANYFKIPFYVAAPLSTIDLETKAGDFIPIEERPEEEVRRIHNITLVPEEADVCNFAFDVTPNHLITAIITEAGIILPPYTDTIANFIQTS